MTSFYEANQQSGIENCAMEKSIIDKSEDSFLFSTLKPCVFIGKNVSSDTFNWVNKDGVELTRYSGTGGPVYFNDGNIKCTLVINRKIVNRLKLCKNWIQTSLSDIGIPTTSNLGSNDISLYAKKICGVSTIENDKKTLFFFFFSLDIDFDVASRVMVLKKHSSDLRDRAAGINQIFEEKITAEQIKNSLKTRFNEYFNDSLQDSLIDDDLQKEMSENLEFFQDQDWIKYGRKFA